MGKSLQTFKINTTLKSFLPKREEAVFGNSHLYYLNFKLHCNIQMCLENPGCLHFSIYNQGKKNGGFKINLGRDNGKGILDSVNHMVMLILYRQRKKNHNVQKKAYSQVNVQNKYLLESLRQNLNPTFVLSNQPVLQFFQDNSDVILSGKRIILMTDLQKHNWSRSNQ